MKALELQNTKNKFQWSKGKNDLTDRVPDVNQRVLNLIDSSDSNNYSFVQKLESAIISQKARKTAR